MVHSSWFIVGKLSEQLPLYFVATNNYNALTKHFAFCNCHELSSINHELNKQ
jgi:hypothetical protein